MYIRMQMISGSSTEGYHFYIEIYVLKADTIFEIQNPTNRVRESYDFLSRTSEGSERANLLILEKEYPFLAMYAL